MIKTGKCPACGRVPLRIHIEHVEIGTIARSMLDGVMYVCPQMDCRTILGVEVDPMATKADTVNDVVKALRGR